MSSRSLREKALSALNRFMDESPNQDDIIFLFHQLRNDPNDRAVALIAACIIDDILEISILTKFRHLNSDERKRLFDPDQPLSSFSAKIRIAYALDLIDRPQQQNLDCVRSIRNAFAHITRPLEFRHPIVVDVCRYLHTDPRFGSDPEQARARYIWAVMDIIEKLTDMNIKRRFPDGILPASLSPLPHKR